MPNSMINVARIVVALLLAGVVVTGCGRKGDLDRPSTPVEQQNTRKDSKAGERDAETVPNQPFLLDPLL